MALGDDFDVAVVHLDSGFIVDRIHRNRDVERQSHVTVELRTVDFIDAGALSSFVRLHNRMRPHRELRGVPRLRRAFVLSTSNPTSYCELKTFRAQRAAPLTRAPDLTAAAYAK
jgi:hypothetical protein